MIAISLITQKILETLWFYLPASTATMAPVIVHRLNLFPSLFKPIDGGLTWKGIRLFGDHKTVRGTLAGFIAALLTGWVQYELSEQPFFTDISLLNYSTIKFSIAQAAILGVGALLGDILKSFFKRRVRIAPGAGLPVFDQIDYIIGASLAALYFNVITISHVALAVIILGFGSHLTSVIGVRLHIKESL
jgi:CDP-2,3-bis-(O-geranylgeranyl)-sn-glycerol synthase